MGPIYEIVILMLLFFGLVLAGVALFFMLLISKLMRTRIKVKRIAVTALVFLLLFSASTLVPRGKREGATLQFIGGSVYVGQEIRYGFPLPWVGTFSTYENATEPLFFFPYELKPEAFLVVFVFWVAISTILVNAITIARNRRQSSASSSRFFPSHIMCIF